MGKKNHLGQSIIEYGLLIALAVAVFSTMTTYLKRGVQGGIKSGFDKLGSQTEPSWLDTEVTSSDHTTTQLSRTTSVDLGGGKGKVTIEKASTVDKTANAIETTFLY